MNRLWGLILVLLCALAFTGCLSVEHKPEIVVHDMIIDTTKATEQQRIHALELEIKELKESTGVHKACNEAEYSALRDFQNTAFAVTITLVTLIVAGLGIAAPILLNRQNQKELKDEVAKIRGELKKAKADIEKAKSEAIQAATTKAQESSTIAMWAAMASMSNDAEEQIDLYTHILDIIPDNSHVLNNRGIAYYDIKAYDKAETDYSKAIEIDPKLSYAYHNRAILYKAMSEQENISDNEKARYMKLAKEDRAECERLKTQKTNQPK